MKIVAATKNEGKLRELRQLLSAYDIEIVPQESVCPGLEIEETGSTFEENAEIKARALYEKTGLTCLADDSGLEVDALNGRPGVYSARYCGENTPYKVKIDTLLRELEGEENRNARFVCSICCITAESGEVIKASGICEGQIGFETRGNGGFGYDPIFYMGEKSVAELSDEQKNMISHRGKALREFIEKFDELYRRKNK